MTDVNNPIEESIICLSCDDFFYKALGFQVFLSRKNIRKTDPDYFQNVKPYTMSTNDENKTYSFNIKKPQLNCMYGLSQEPTISVSMYSRMRMFNQDEYMYSDNTPISQRRYSN